MYIAPSSPALQGRSRTRSLITLLTLLAAALWPSLAHAAGDAWVNTVIGAQPNSATQPGLESQVVVDATGTATTAWYAPNRGGLVYSRRAPGGGWSAPAAIPGATVAAGHTAGSPQLAKLPGGGLIVVWRDTAGEGASAASRIFASRFDGTTWGAASEPSKQWTDKGIEGQGITTGGVVLAADSSGVATVAWTTKNAMVITRSSGTGWTEPIAFRGPDLPRDLMDPKIALDSSDNVLVMWRVPYIPDPEVFPPHGGTLASALWVDAAANGSGAWMTMADDGWGNSLFGAIDPTAQAPFGLAGSWPTTPTATRWYQPLPTPYGTGQVSDLGYDLTALPTGGFAFSWTAFGGPCLSACSGTWSPANTTWYATMMTVTFDAPTAPVYPYKEPSGLKSAAGADLPSTAAGLVTVGSRTFVAWEGRGAEAGSMYVSERLQQGAWSEATWSARQRLGSTATGAPLRSATAGTNAAVLAWTSSASGTVSAATLDASGAGFPLSSVVDLGIGTNPFVAGRGSAPATTGFPADTVVTMIGADGSVRASVYGDSPKPTPDDDSQDPATPLAPAPYTGASPATSPAPLPARRPLPIRRGTVSPTTISTSVAVPGPGVVRQVGTAGSGQTGRDGVAACAGRAVAKKAGTVRVSCSLTAAARRKLRTSSLTITVTTTFTPKGGGVPMTSTSTYVVKKAKAGSAARSRR